MNKAVFKCDKCGKTIFTGNEYYECPCDGNVICADCLERMTAKEIVDLCDIDSKELIEMLHIRPAIASETDIDDPWEDDMK